MKIKKVLGSGVVTAVLLLALAGCQEKEGPAEKAGKEIDQAAAELGGQTVRCSSNRSAGRGVVARYLVVVCLATPALKH
jgi:uncharacterized lipoprotein YehR (DUF1307 family)